MLQQCSSRSTVAVLGVFQANAQLQDLEEERISQMQEFMNQYKNHLSVIGPKMTQVDRQWP